MADKFTREEDKRFTLRIDRELFATIEKSAKDNKRSIGREIEFILAQHFQKNTIFILTSKWIWYILLSERSWRQKYDKRKSKVYVPYDAKAIWGYIRQSKRKGHYD